MEIIFPDPTYDTATGMDREAVLEELRDAMSEVSAEIEVKDTDIGHGADWPAFLVALTAASSLFFLGKPINENLEAWLDLGRKLKLALKRAAATFHRRRLDSTALTLLSLNHVEERKKSPIPIRSIKVVASHYLPAGNFDGRDAAHLDHHPDGLFVLVLEIDDMEIRVFVLKSDGTLVTKETFASDWYEFWNTGDRELPMIDD